MKMKPKAALLLAAIVTLSACGNGSNETAGIATGNSTSATVSSAAPSNIDSNSGNATTTTAVTSEPTDIAAETTTETTAAVENPELLNGTIGDFVVNNGVLEEYIGQDTDIVIPDGFTASADDVFA